MDLIYENLAKLAYEPYLRELKTRPGARWLRGQPDWALLGKADREVWVTVVQRVTGTVAAADLV